MGASGVAGQQASWIVADTRARPWASVTLWVAAAVIAAALAVPLLTLTRHIPLSYNEGWNAYFTARAMNPAMGPLYPPATTLIANNYPPLSFYITGWVTRLTGDPIIAGRVIALVAMVAASGLAGVISRQLGAERRWAVAVAGVMLAYASALYWRYAGIADPQWLAQAVMLGGVALLLQGGAGGIAGRRWSPLAIVASALLMTAALLIKHNLLGAPAAVAAWLLVTDRRSGLVWGGALAAATALSLAALMARFGDAFTASVLHHSRVFSVARLLDGLDSAARLIPMVLIAGLIAVRWRDLRVLFALLFALAALGCGILQRGGEGVSYNAYFEALAALTVALGVALSQAEHGRVILGGRAVAPPVLLALIALPFAIAAPAFVARQASALATLDARERDWRALEQRVAATDGPIACELLSTCFWAGKPFEWDFFNEAQRLKTGAPAAPIIARLRRHDFAAIALTHPPGFAASDEERLPQPLPRLIDAYYRPALVAPDATVLMIPRARRTAP